MRTILLTAGLLTAGVLALISGPVLAQDATPAPTHAKPHIKKHHTGIKPIDNGPTPGSDAAYQGGGEVLQGAPGAPAPQPMATPPGQTPANAVPH